MTRQHIAQPLRAVEADGAPPAAVRRCARFGRISHSTHICAHERARAHEAQSGVLGQARGERARVLVGYHRGGSGADH